MRVKNLKLEASDIDELRPVIQATVCAILEEIKPMDARLKDRIAFSEKEAAELMGVPQHVLRDARYRGEVSAKRLGKKVMYSLHELRRFWESLETA